MSAAISVELNDMFAPSEGCSPGAPSAPRRASPPAAPAAPGCCGSSFDVCIRHVGTPALPRRTHCSDRACIHASFTR